MSKMLDYAETMAWMQRKYPENAKAIAGYVQELMNDREEWRALYHVARDQLTGFETRLENLKRKSKEELEAVRREAWEAARQKDVTAFYADSNRQSEFVMRYVCFEEWLATLEAK